jgi:hypothetical protein
VRSALPLTLVALALFGCGGGSGATASTSGAKSAADSKAGAKHAAAGDTAGLAPDDSKATGVNELLQVLDDLPTQDELDAQAAARITEATAESEYEKLKAEIEAEMEKPPEGG